MAVDYEAVSNWLLSLLQQASFGAPVNGRVGWQNNGSAQRRLMTFEKVGVDQQPAMFLVAHDQEVMQTGRGIPAKRVIPYSVVCYFRAEAGDVGDTSLNTLLAALEGVLAPYGADVPENVNTLNQQVYRCWIRGKVYRDPGDLDNQGMLVVPVEVMVP